MITIDLRTTWQILIIVLIALHLPACGQKGPLVLPQPGQSQPEQAQPKPPEQENNRGA